MNTLCKIRHSEASKLAADMMPPLQLHEWDSIPSQIATHFRRILHGSESLGWVQLPSIMQLAELFHCSEWDIFDALRELKEQSYEYQLQGLDGCIQLRDSLLRPTRKIHHQFFIPENFWNLYQKFKLNPQHPKKHKKQGKRALAC